MISGMVGFLNACTLVLVVQELAALIEETIRQRFELRRGFWGSKGDRLQLLLRHVVGALRYRASGFHHAIGAIQFAVLVVATGTLPGWADTAPINTQHSLWVFLLLMFLTPIVALSSEWLHGSGRVPLKTLAYVQRGITSVTLLVILSLTLVSIVGTDSIQEIHQKELENGWLVFQYPFTLLLFPGFLLAHMYLSFRQPFSPEQRATSGAGFSLWHDEFAHTVFTIFSVEIFFGGNEFGGSFGVPFLLAKCLFLRLTVHSVARQFIKLREDQAESLLLWRLTPFTLILMTAALLFSKGHL